MRKFIFIQLFLALIILTSCKADNNVGIEISTKKTISDYEISETNQNLETEVTNFESKKETEKLTKPEDEIPVSQSADYALFTDGTGQTPETTIRLGDNFLGWTLTKLVSSMDIYSNGFIEQSEMEAWFSGEKTIKGTIDYSGYGNEALNNYISVEVSENKYKKLFPVSINLYQNENFSVKFVLRNEGELIKILEDKGIEGYINCELVIKDYYTLFMRTSALPNATFVSVNLENATINPSVEIDLDSSQILEQEKDGNTYTINTTHDFNNNYSIHIFDESQNKLQTIPLENEFFKRLSFKDINFDGYMDIIADIGRPLSETKTLYTWDFNAQRFNKVVFEGFDLLSYFEVYDGYLKAWLKDSGAEGVDQKLIWKGNNLVLET